jgi:hypothetical protein
MSDNNERNERTGNLDEMLERARQLRTKADIANDRRRERRDTAVSRRLPGTSVALSDSSME